MKKYSMEMVDPGYAKVHLSTCSHLSDPLPLGNTLEEIADNWPWPEEVEDATDKWFYALCAMGAFRD